MMMFILSKLNMLILAVAIFVIFVAFAFSLHSIVFSDLATKIAERPASYISSALASSSACEQKTITFPREYSPFGIFNFTYVLKFRAVNMKDYNYLIISVFDRSAYLRLKDKAAAVSAKAVPINAIPKFFEYDPAIGYICPANELTMDVRGIHALDTLVVIKETFNGKDYLYLIPCSSLNPMQCKWNKQMLACYMYKKRNTKSRCLDVKDLSNCLITNVSCW